MFCNIITNRFAVCKYSETIRQLHVELKRKKKLSRILLGTKLISFLLSAAFIYVTFTQPYGVLSGMAAAVCAAVYVFALIRDARCIRAMEQMEALIQACQNELGYFKGDFRPFDNGARYISSGHAFTYDLDIFGEDSLYQRINRTRTEGGSDILARKLSEPESNRDTIMACQEAVDDLSHRFEWRLRFIAGPKIKNRFVALFRETETSFCSRYLASSGQKIRNILSCFSSVITLLMLAGYILDWWSGIWFSLFFFVQLGICSTQNKKTMHTILATDKLHREFKGYLELLREIRNERFRATRLCRLQHELFDTPDNSIRAFQELTRIQNLFDQRSNALMYVALNGLFLYDLQLQNRFHKWINRYAGRVEKWADEVSEIDALVSLAQYAANNPQNVMPRLLSGPQAPVIRARGMYHPFLAHKHPVSNDFTLERKRIAIVTGANMAGKSTFLRTIGINYILATTGAPVCARIFECSLVSLFSSMRTADNLSHDISYFHAELLRLQQLLRHVSSHDYTLIILDEILKGTNSKDKLHGSILFLNELARYNMSALIATHDLELARQEEKDSSLYENYCFEIELAHEIRYNYRIERGVAQNLNASFLLRDILASCRQNSNREKQNQPDDKSSEN